MNGCTVWYRLDVAVHNYSYLIIKINNYNELPTFLLNTGIHVYLSQRRASRIVRRRASSYVDGCRIFVIRVNLLVLTRPNLAGLIVTSDRLLCVENIHQTIVDCSVLEAFREYRDDLRDHMSDNTQNRPKSELGKIALSVM